MTVETTKKKRESFSVAIIVTGVIALIGIGMWVFQNIEGLVISGMRDYASWGLYMAMFMFFVGLSVGSSIASSAPRVFGFKGFDGISKVAVFISIVCAVLAIVFIVIDLGGPLKLWHMFAFTNFVSPLAWDMVILAVYSLLSIAYLWLIIQNEKGKRDDASLKTVSVVMFVLALIVPCMSAWIFGLQSARPFLHTALMAPWFVCSALVSGFGLVIVTVIALRKTGYIELEDDNLQKMTTLLAICILVDLFLFFCDLLTSGYAGAGDEFLLVQTMLTGALAPYFWIEMIGGLVAVGILFAPRLRKRKGFVVLAACLALLGVYLKRFQLIEGGFQYPPLAYPGAPGIIGAEIPGAGGFWQSLGSSLAYWPTFWEIGITIGALSLGACLVLLGMKYLPLAPQKDNR